MTICFTCNTDPDGNPAEDEIDVAVVAVAAFVVINAISLSYAEILYP